MRVDRSRGELVSVGGTIVPLDGRSVSVMIRDVSANGCSVASDEVLPVAQVVRLNRGSKGFEAEMRWALVGAAGLQLKDEKSRAGVWPAK